MAGTSVLVAGGPFAGRTPRTNCAHWTTNVRVVDVPAFRIGRFRRTSQRMARLHRRRRLHPVAVVVGTWLAAPPARGADRSAILRSGGRTRTRFGQRRGHSADEPGAACRYFEAEAYAAWAGGLPTEVEQKAAAWGSRRLVPPPLPVGNRRSPQTPMPTCGRAPRRWAPTRRGIGVTYDAGDVWEWTTRRCSPGRVVLMVYERVPQPFFGGDYRAYAAARAVEPAILRPSFRNWDHPYRRQIFAGVRLAWDI